ncbi:MAG: glucose-1-phosphate cytidylyltransferase [Planctomycetota bacterium]|nr:glucose-1-phosphate cytidylyltransferase [Planctomycetota bacterium]MDI6787429.1 glucose-1-phosphate cytidylyltransferase [Planctomycetota bacterium]
MKVVILAGGLGLRLSEETEIKPKPMIEIGEKPILWHIMKIYSHYGFNDFIVCLGYRGYLIKEFFANYLLHQSDVTIDVCRNKIRIHQNYSEPWCVTLVNTGLETQTGGRIKRVKKYVGNETFMFTYGDGVANVNIPDLIKFHKKHGKYATVTAVQPPGRFGALNINNKNTVINFQEKVTGDGGLINGGFFVLEPEIFNYIEGDQTYWEGKPMETIAKHGQLKAYKHTAFWKPMDTLRERKELESLWNSGKAPWKIWKD